MARHDFAHANHVSEVKRRAEQGQKERRRGLATASNVVSKESEIDKWQWQRGNIGHLGPSSPPGLVRHAKQNQVDRMSAPD
jgi:hypothetical protein